ncbi:expressed unknown protein [Seminavis robusta]|uniref:Sulfotransferase n=1 Tax=Seminavis robusta TaxID=568900 RepID=A0A9N8DS56_9STRA|nr:expressed unknown protein [Seminavis robusta]|eukprot:Sro243_g096970.1 n/a (397) ;mRNA; r:61164-62354
MTVITPPSRVAAARRNFRKYLFLGVAIGACTCVARWSQGYYNAARAFAPPPHIKHFDKGEKGYKREHYCIDNSDREECCSEYQCTMFVTRSTLYSDCCNHVHNTDEKTVKRGRQHSHLLPLLITSAPRSGTRFIQQLFTRVGMTGLTTDSHSPQNRGQVSWKHVFDDEDYVVGDTNPTHLYKSKFRVIWHLVRDPLKSLTSMAFTEPLLEDTAKSDQYVKYVSKHIHLSNQSTLRDFFRITPDEWETRANHTDSEKMHKFLVYRGMEIYLHWHGFINYLNVPIFRLEDLAVDKNVTVLDEVFHSVGIQPPRHSEVMSYLEAQEYKREQYQNRRRRLKKGRDRFRSKKDLHKDEREHRETLNWRELCHVDKRKARDLLKMSQSFGYYQELDEETLCQ